MQVAERNIDDRLRVLTTESRQFRQTSITSELLDIISSFEALGTKPQALANPEGASFRQLQGLDIPGQVVDPHIGFRAGAATQVEKHRAPDRHVFRSVGQHQQISANGRLHALGRKFPAVPFRQSCQVRSARPQCG